MGISPKTNKRGGSNNGVVGRISQKLINVEVLIRHVVGKIFSKKIRKTPCLLEISEYEGWHTASYASLCRSLALLLLRCTHSNFTSVHKGPIRHNLSGDNSFDPFKLQLMRMMQRIQIIWTEPVLSHPWSFHGSRGKVVGKP